MYKTKLLFLSPKTTLIVGCVLALGAHFIWNPSTVLNLVIAFIAWGLTDVIFPGSAGAGSHGYVATTIAAVFKVGMFFLPSFTLLVSLRKRVSDRNISLLIIGWMVVYV